MCEWSGVPPLSSSNYTGTQLLISLLPLSSLKLYGHNRPKEVEPEWRASKLVMESHRPADTLMWDKGASDFQGTQQCTYCDLSKCVSLPPGHNVGAGNSGMGTKGWRGGWQEIYKGERDWKSVSQDDSMYKMSKQLSKINRKTVDKRTPRWNHSIPNKHLQELIYRKNGHAQHVCDVCH